ncbi:MAG: nitrile hydratase subunit alpha [Cyanobacteria bacterium]|nr:nitrile hydratase subunit alpha [Cyanobacteriota bacterium]MDA0865551.1 nitrile hydratase subunit alpha [Cyanobacteriota bacterium]
MASHHHHPESEIALRVKAIESLLVEKGIVDPATLDTIIETYEHKVGPHIGAQIVAKAWVDPDFKARLLDDGTGAIAELGLTGFSSEHMVVVENTPEVHNLIVCTLCSCYPWAILGLPPTWYKSFAYRSRVVIEPRKVLQEFGLEIPEHVEVRVWDSNADLRYLVLPERPAETAGMSEADLASLITRNAMIGTAKVPAPTSLNPPVAQEISP